MTELLAKSKSHGVLTLEQHLSDTEACAEILFDPEQRWGKAWVRFFRLDRGGAEAYLRHVRVAALFHDIGKANEDFLRAVSGEGEAQTIRHEHLSALVMCLPEVRAWLAAAEKPVDVDVVTAAILSHHLKASEGGDWKWCQAHGACSVRLHLSHAQVRSAFDRVAGLLSIPKPPPILEVATWSNASPWQEAFAAGMRSARALRRQSDPARKALLAATKAGLIAADAASSGLVRTGQPITDWLRAVAHSDALAADEVRAHVIAPRLASISKKRNAQVGLHPFQERAGCIGPRGLLLAACGAGKTLAAWRWAEAQAQSRPIGRVLFLYPTRGTATEGFRDYVSWAPETTSALVHGTALYELERMRENPAVGRTGREGQLSEADKRLFALGLWPRRYFSATVDQFLSFLEHRYESLCLLPVLADSALVIDEVHSFDRRMFDALIAFLKHFDVPVLCMTATLPLSQIDQLRECGLRVFPDAAEIAELADLQRLEHAPRYRHLGVEGLEQAFELATAAFRDGRRVLWVVNIVARAQALADRLEQALGTSVLCYHSRYRLEDRQRAHARTVEAFQQRESPAIAVTTQVCEMSLDLDADVLLSEHAPVTSLVQRFGRANRHLARPDWLGQLVTYSAESTRPYDSEDLEHVPSFLEALGPGDLSQARLAQLLLTHAPSRRLSLGDASFLDSGYFAVPGDFREVDDFSRPAILDTELEAVWAALKARSPIDGFVVPVPRRQLIGETGGAAGLPKYLGVAPAVHYRADRGFVVPER